MVPGVLTRRPPKQSFRRMESGLSSRADRSLKKIPRDGGPAQTICEVLDSRGGAWGPDGTILFTDGPARPIFRVPSSGGMPAQLTTLAGGDRGEGHRSPEFLPDGRHFLFHATANNADNPGIQLGSLDGGAPMRLLPDDSNSIFVPVAGAAGGGAEGGHVFFLRDGTLMALPFESHPAEGNRRGLPRRGRCGDCSQQPLWCLFSGGKRHSGVLGRGGGANNRELVWMDRSGKRLNALGKPNAFVSVNLLSLSPNGKTVAATVGTSQQSDIWLLDLASGSIGRFTFGFSGTFPVWSPDRQVDCVIHAGPRITLSAGRSLAARKSCCWRTSSTPSRQMSRPTGNSSFTT